HKVYQGSKLNIGELNSMTEFFSNILITAHVPLVSLYFISSRIVHFLELPLVQMYRVLLQAHHIFDLMSLTPNFLSFMYYLGDSPIFHAVLPVFICLMPCLVNVARVFGYSF
ncbi:hypothetical protein L9F63_014683, partial [Diploptera punctata]